MTEFFARVANGIALAWRHNPVAVIVIVAMTVLVVVDFGLVMFMLGVVTGG